MGQLFLRLNTLGVCLLSLSGCAFGRQEPRDPGTVGTSQDVETSGHDEEPAAVQPRPEVAENAIADAARSFTGFRLSDEKQLTDEELFTYLASADAICIGERHDQVLDHYAELRALEAFIERREMRGYELALGLEMVRSEAQGVLQLYQSAQIDRDGFLKETRWEQEWGFPIQYYDPQLLTAFNAKVPVLALGTDRVITRKIAETGLESLSEDEVRKIPELDTSSKEHRQLFESLMKGHPGTEEMDLTHYYEAQVVWDESMAELVAEWIKKRKPLGKMLIFAGTAHCHRTAMPARIEHISGMKVANLIVQEGKSQVPSDADSAEMNLLRGYDYQMVFDQ